MIDSAHIAVRVQSLRSMPAIVMRLFSLMNDERTSGSDFENAVRPDAAMTANLLRAANSALYPSLSPCVSVGQAINRLGTVRVIELVAADAFRQMLPERIPGYEMSSASFWLHCVAVAMLSERLAKRTKLKCAPQAFVAGLLHDIGKLVVGDFLAKEKAIDLLNGTQTFIALESEALGTNHCEVGFEIARQWRLPEEVGVVARWHHQPEDAPPNHAELVAVVHVANALAHLFGFGTDAGELHRGLSAAAVAKLGLTLGHLETLAGEAFNDIFTFVRLGEGQREPT